MDLLMDINTNSSGNSRIELPELELPRFGGYLMDWPWFYDSFMYFIDKSTTLTTAEKFSYLLGLLEGEAKQAVSGFCLTEINYKKALEILKERFGRPERLKQYHISSLLQIEFPPHMDVNQYVSTISRILAHVRSLEALDVKGESAEPFLCTIILRRLPEDMLRVWSRGAADKECDLKYLMEFLNNEIRAQETFELFKKL
ncbi:unnamed protein product [Meganyctiphanes norvegica]|uniref:Uncharacterized protein n=1 Tax=Meganyctiphanes norvegica TaxID=48144 RepID=A0AAV2R0Z2_MEGNR